MLNSDDPDTYVEFHAGATHFAMPPDTPRPPLANLFNSASKRGAWFLGSAPEKRKSGRLLQGECDVGNYNGKSAH